MHSDLNPAKHISFERRLDRVGRGLIEPSQCYKDANGFGAAAHAVDPLFSKALFGLPADLRLLIKELLSQDSRGESEAPILRAAKAARLLSATEELLRVKSESLVKAGEVDTKTLPALNRALTLFNRAFYEFRGAYSCVSELIKKLAGDPPINVRVKAWAQNILNSHAAVIAGSLETNVSPKDTSAVGVPKMPNSGRRTRPAYSRGESLNPYKFLGRRRA